MKRIFLFLVILLISFSISGCKSNFHDNLGDITDNQNVTDSSTPTNEKSYIQQLKLAYEGRMDKTKPIIGENVEQYLDENYDMYCFSDGLAFNNGYIELLANGYLDDNKNPVYGDVAVIIKDEAYDIKTGMSMDEVEFALGKPHEIIDFSLGYDESELYGSNTIFTYDVGDYQVVIVFDSSCKNVIAVHLNGTKNNLGYPSFVNKIDLLDLSQEELVAYNNFKSTYDEVELRGLEPISIMKLYLHACMEKDYETEWELYSKEENQLGWDKEYHMSIKETDRRRDYSVFENAVNIRTFYDKDDVYASISFEDKYLEEYDISGYPFRFGFSLVKSKAGIWKVAFMPMQ